MNILFDLITPQSFVGGAGEYVRKVFYTLLDAIKVSGENVKIFGIYNSNKNKFAYPDLTPNAISQLGVTPVDIAKTTLKEVIAVLNIDKVFIGCAQYWNSVDVENLTIPTVCVIHDLDVEEYDRNKIDDYVRLGNLKDYLRYRFHVYRKGKHDLIYNQNIRKMLLSNPNAQLVTVSDYSKHSIMYNFGISEERINVLYSPERVTNRDAKIENAELRSIIESGRKYYLMVGANRVYKNPSKAINAFRKFADIHKDCYFITLGAKEQQFPNHIILPYLSESDLANVMAHCYAFVFPSYFEGFGYPPVEAMSYDKPILCSNVTSIPEVCGDAAIYFSPYYETDIFRALLALNESNYNAYVEKSKARYQQVSLRQQRDLDTLINLILA